MPAAIMELPALRHLLRSTQRRPTMARILDKRKRSILRSKRTRTARCIPLTMLLADHFLPSKNYDRYISLTVAQKTGNITDDHFYVNGLFLAEYRFTDAQQQALRKYYDPNTPGDRAAKRAALAQEFDAHQDTGFPLNWETFAQDMGLFGGAKA